jgi:hypothetical protein
MSAAPAQHAHRHRTAAGVQLLRHIQGTAELTIAAADAQDTGTAPFGRTCWHVDCSRVTAAAARGAALHATAEYSVPPNCSCWCCRSST